MAKDEDLIYVGICRLSTTRIDTDGCESYLSACDRGQVSLYTWEGVPERFSHCVCERPKRCAVHIYRRLHRAAPQATDVDHKLPTVRQTCRQAYRRLHRPTPQATDGDHKLPTAWQTSGEHIFWTKNGKFIAFPVTSGKWSLSSVLVKKIQLGVLEPSDGHQSPEYTKQSIW